MRTLSPGIFSRKALWRSNFQCPKTHYACSLFIPWSKTHSWAHRQQRQHPCSLGNCNTDSVLQSWNQTTDMKDVQNVSPCQPCNLLPFWGERQQLWFHQHEHMRFDKLKCFSTINALGCLAVIDVIAILCTSLAPTKDKPLAFIEQQFTNFARKSPKQCLVGLTSKTFMTQSLPSTTHPFRSHPSPWAL